MIGELANHLWQTTVFATAVVLLALTLKRNRASIRFGLWFAASIKFLIPFAFLIGLGSYAGLSPALQVVAPHRDVAPAVATAAVRISEPFVAEAAIPVSPVRGQTDWLPVIFEILWAGGFCAIVIARLRTWSGIRAAIRRSTAAYIPGIDLPPGVEVRFAADALCEPGVVGWWRPILLLPEGITERLASEQLRAVIAHELCHVRRRDNLTSAVHMAVESVFWFHPLVWLIGNRLVEERERACDEEVIRTGNAPEDYAEGILTICKSCVEYRLRCVSGVSGANLKKRLRLILAEATGSELNPLRKLALAAATFILVGLPVFAGIVKVPVVEAQIPQDIILHLMPRRPVEPQQSGGEAHENDGTPKWDKVSVQRCGDFAKGSNSSYVNGKLTLYCQVFRGLLQMAYVEYAAGRSSNPEFVRHPDGTSVYVPRSTRVEGGPSWMDFQSFDIAATSSDTRATHEMMPGPMMQTVLENHFHLKIRHETRPIPIYRMTVAAGGPKLQRFQGGTCVPILNRLRILLPSQEQLGGGLRLSGPPAVSNVIIQAAPLTQDNPCLLSVSRTESGTEFDVQGASLSDLSEFLSPLLARPVFDDTGIAGLFDFHLEYSAPAGSNPATAITAALERQLGLKFEPATGQSESIVVDHVEMPTPNGR